LAALQNADETHARWVKSQQPFSANTCHEVPPLCGLREFAYQAVLKSLVLHYDSPKSLQFLQN